MISSKNGTRLALALAAIIAWPLCAGADAGESWRLKKKHEGIEIYVRRVPGSKVDEFRGVMRLAGTRLSSLVAAFDDTPSYTRWMHECIEATLVKKITLYERVTYSVTRAPWPVWNRDMVTHSIVSQDPGTLAVTIRMTALPGSDLVPLRERIVRVPMMRGAWSFTPLESGEIEVTYQMRSDPGGTLPQGLANMAVVDLPYYTLRNLRNTVREEPYASAVVPQVTEPKPKAGK